MKTRKNGDLLVACFPEDYESLLDTKVRKLHSLLSSKLNDYQTNIYQSPKSHFRMR
jgi:hypothetical protein